jgi:uncharacterized membrane protein YgcG
MNFIQRLFGKKKKVELKAPTDCYSKQIGGYQSRTPRRFNSTGYTPPAYDDQGANDFNSFGSLGGDYSNDSSQDSFNGFGGGSFGGGGASDSWGSSDSGSSDSGSYDSGSSDSSSSSD